MIYYINIICHIKRSSGCILMFIPSHFMCVKKIKSFHHVVGGKLVQIVHNVPSTSSDRPPGYLGLVWKRCAFHASFQGGGSGSGGRGGAGAGGRGSGSGGGTNGPMGKVWIMFPEKYWKEILESRIWHTIST